MTIADKLALLEQTKEAQRVKLGLPKNLPFNQYIKFIRDPFTPTELFKNGEQGVWLDPSDLSTMFQDEHGATPVTKDGDPVGMIKDKSGNSNHATQPTASARPIYRTDGKLHWLEFDGVDDWLGVSGFSWLSTENTTAQATLSVGYLPKRNSGYVLHAAGTQGTNRQGFGLLTRDNGVERIRLGLNTDIVSSGTYEVITGTFSVPLRSGYFLANKSQNGQLSAVEGLGSSEVLTIGCRTPSSPAIFYKGSIFNILISEGYKAQDISREHRYTGMRTGLSL